MLLLQAWMLLLHTSGGAYRGAYQCSGWPSQVGSESSSTGRANNRQAAIATARAAGDIDGRRNIDV